MPNPDVTLLSSVTETTDHEYGSGTVVSISGDRAQMALIDAVVATYHSDATVLDDRDWWHAQATAKAKVTVLRSAANMLGAPMLVACPGTLFVSGTSGAIAMLPKGSRTRGVRLDISSVIDVVPGHDVETLRRTVDAVRAAFPPTLRALTKERLCELPTWDDDSEDTPPCSLAVFGSWPSPDGGVAPGSVWLLHSYDEPSDIAEGVLYVDDSIGCSEHGSIYGRELLRWRVGEIVGMPAVPGAEAFEWLDLDIATVRGRILERLHPKAA